METFNKYAFIKDLKEEIQNEIVPSLLESSTDLDTAVHLVIGLIENEIGAV